MSGGIVLDASAGAKLLLDEDLSPHARALFRDTVTARQPVYAPPLLLAEILSVLYQRARGLVGGTRSARGGGITFEQADQLLREFLALRIDLVAPPDLYTRALTDARDYELPSSYDAIYVALARLLGLELWTDDRRLLEALGPSVPWVRWLGDYPVGPPDRALS
jgi:predicted nucleic acid-binding protein